MPEMSLMPTQPRIQQATAFHSERVKGQEHEADRLTTSSAKATNVCVKLQIYSLIYLYGVRRNNFAYAFTTLRRPAGSRKVVNALSTKDDP
jgi:hypothetical protein